jgi:isoleucyl-tRNA synthetase
VVSEFKKRNQVALKCNAPYVSIISVGFVVMTLKGLNTTKKSQNAVKKNPLFNQKELLKN